MAVYSPYANTGVADQRDNITKALMDISSPPPVTPSPQMPQMTPQMQMPQTPVSGSPPQGTPMPAATPQTMPLAPAMPPQLQPTGAAPGAAAMGGVMQPALGMPQQQM